MTVQEFLMESEFFLRIVVAGICGCIIGYERKNRNKEAGIRTHAIVALASALMIVVSKYGFYDIVEYDASRVAAQIVSGIGFLGAGIIFVRHNTVSGLTTAAGIWATAGIGMAIGSGLYYIGIITTVLVVVIQILMHKSIFLYKEPMHETISLLIDRKDGGIDTVKNELLKNKIDIVSLDMEKLEGEKAKIEMGVIFPAGYDRSDLLTLFESCSSVLSVQG